MTTLRTSPLHDVLDRLHAAAEKDDDLDIAPLPTDATAAERADALARVYMPVSGAGGALLYSLVRAARPQTVVEFGTSYGISTLYLAAAVRDNGTGRVVTTELSATKVAAARRNLADAGVADVVEVLPGDALETLATVPGPVGLVLLDGWKDLYLPVLHLLEPRLTPGALVIADDTSFASVKPYLDHVRDPANGYVTTDFPVEDGMEVSCRS
ncbi:O-methyltransferase [Virgisporangium aurantiacum]|uniref:Putative O-methyltransferase, family 3 n=1 Tax=Virgisporangium aurantiacum TaxID=175570 RepID=A0A8J3ZEB4_9ACTN|nr:class I SAM-dependent methyltransferase [Virgisporangium aurantiacum]GIJ62599.1 putative O-methyltransferase, family 3 [Virgisporangium aurantiacum]